MSVRHEGSEGTTRSGSAGTGPCGRDGSRVRAELAAGGCHGQAGWAGRSAGSGTVSGCPPCRNQLRPLDRVGCTRQGWDEAWRDLRSGMVGLRLCRRCGTCAAGASPPVPAVRGLHLRAERDGAGVAVAVGQQGCGTGRQTRLWHWRGGAAMLAPALAHPGAEPSLSLSLPSHGRCCGGDRLCPRPRAGPQCPLPPPAALHINPPGSSCHPAGCRRAGPAPRRHPRLAAWSWRCRPPGWRWRRGARSRRRDLRSEGQTWGAVAAPGAPPAPRGVPGEEGTG